MEHIITQEIGPMDRGGWPYVWCSCGWRTTSKDMDIVKEAVESHLEENK